jgi:hypothetical protein
MHPWSERWVRVKSGVWPGLLVREAGRSQKRATFLLGQAFWLERRARVGSKRCSFLARPSGRRGRPESKASAVSLGQAFRSEIGSSNLPSGLSLGIWASLGVVRHSQHRLLVQDFARKQVHEGP